MKGFWSSNDEVCRAADKYGIRILEVACEISKAKNPSLPTNSYVVQYSFEDANYIDIVQGKRSDIFDCYYDKLGKGHLQSIYWTDGRTNPKLFDSKAYLKQS